MNPLSSFPGPCCLPNPLQENEEDRKEGKGRGKKGGREAGTDVFFRIQ